MGKRAVDFTLALIALIFLSPVFLVLALLIKLETGGSVFFLQKRVGKNEKPFTIFKFRSMYEKHGLTPEELGPVKHNHAVVTKLGHFMRRTKLDEIPQFVNVLMGTMSIVGPRPCLYSSLEEMSEDERRRFSVSPGVSGWAEVNGNVELTWHEQLALDLWYIDHQSFWLDWLIIGKTLKTIFWGSIRNEKALLQAHKHEND